MKENQSALATDQLTAPRPTIKCVYENGNSIIHLPLELGGGKIIEEDYQLTDDQLKNMRSLGFETEFDGFPTPEDQAQPLSFDANDVISRTRTAHLWEIKDMLRIFDPLVSFIESKKSLGLELSDEEIAFTRNFSRINKSTDKQLSKWSESEEGVHEREYVTEIINNQNEQKDRKLRGAMYFDDTHDPYRIRKAAERRIRVESGMVFTHAYIGSRLGKVTMALIRKEMSPEEISEQWQAVSALDALTVGYGVISDDMKIRLTRAAKSILGFIPFYLAQEARLPKARTAAPRLISGGESTMISRPAPGAPQLPVDA